jgi:hypothetical protein
MTVHLASGGVLNCPFDKGHFGLDVPPDEALTITVETESLKSASVSGQKYGADNPAAGGANFDPNEYAKQMKAQGAPVKGIQSSSRPYMEVPAKYADKATSPLTIMVGPGITDKIFTLED